MQPGIKCGSSVLAANGQSWQPTRTNYLVVGTLCKITQRTRYPKTAGLADGWAARRGSAS
jgi:hypothetical protein